MPCGIGPTPKISATVWPRSAKVCRVPRSTPAPSPRARRQERHVFARMVGARRRRIVAVVGGHNQQIVFPSRGRRSLRRASKRSRFAA